MARGITHLFFFYAIIHAVATSSGPPAAQPPDLETLKWSLSEGDGAGRVRRVVITRKTTEATTPITATEATATGASHGSDFADPDFSAERIMETTGESIGNPTTVEPTTTKESSTLRTQKSSETSAEKSSAIITEEPTTVDAETTTTTEVPTTTTEEATKPTSTTAETTTTKRRKESKRTRGTTRMTTEEATTTEATTTEATTTTTTEAVKTTPVEQVTTTEKTTTTNEPSTVAEIITETTTEATTVTTETTPTEATTSMIKMGKRRVIIRKKTPTTTEAPTTTSEATTTTTTEAAAPEQIRTTVAEKKKPQDDDHLSPMEEMRLLKKLAKQGIAFGVRNRELELIHTDTGDLSLPPFAFSEDDNTVEETVATEETSAETTPTTTTSTTTQATTTTTEDNQIKEKEIQKFRNEPFKVGTNIVPVHLFFNQNQNHPMTMRLRKRKRNRTTTVAPIQEENKGVMREEVTTTAPSAFVTDVPLTATTKLPRVDDFLIAMPEKAQEEEDLRKLDSFTFPSTPVIDRTTQRPAQKSKLPDKMVLPSLLEMPKLSVLSSFGSLSAPVHPTGVSQRIRPTRVDSETAGPVEKNRTSGKMRSERRRRILRKKTHAVVSVPIDRDTASRPTVRARFIGETRPPVAPAAPVAPVASSAPVAFAAPVAAVAPVVPAVVAPRVAPVAPVSFAAPIASTVTVAPTAPVVSNVPVHVSQKIIRSNDPAQAEQSFAASLTKKSPSTMDLVIESLRKIKKSNREILNKSRARAAAAGKTVQATARASHEGFVGKAVRIEGNTDRRPTVVDRDFSRKTVDRDV